MIKRHIKSSVIGLMLGFLLLPVLVFADRDFERVVVFGDSLSDPGNAFYIIGLSLYPPYSSLDEFLIPDAPYARGGNHFSDGATWVEQFAAKLDLADSVGPAFKDENKHELKMTNYAVGGARARDQGQRVNLAAQLGTYFSNTQGLASEHALYVLALGANDVRDAVNALAQDSTGLGSAKIIATALSAVSDAVISLYNAGARTMLVANVPDLSLIPAMQRLDQIIPGATMGAAIMSAKFNSELDGLLTSLAENSPGLVIIRMDVYEATREIIGNPKAYGLDNVQDACVMPNQKPVACEKPNTYFFWDGIHPTQKAHRIFAKKAHQAYQAFKQDSELICPRGRKSNETECRTSLWL
jgi:phospholipase/lecithinase/hemolysin